LELFRGGWKGGGLIGKPRRQINVHRKQPHILQGRQAANSVRRCRTTRRLKMVVLGIRSFRGGGVSVT